MKKEAADLGRYGQARKIDDAGEDEGWRWLVK